MLGSSMKVFLAPGATDLRKSINGHPVRVLQPQTGFGCFCTFRVKSYGDFPLNMQFYPVLNGPMTQAGFRDYLTERLLPKLNKGDVVIMDNATSHKGEEVWAAFKDFGVVSVYLPPYSPDLNPIELLFSKLKQTVRSIVTTTKDELDRAIDIGLRKITKKDLKGRFHHSRYCTK